MAKYPFQTVDPHDLKCTKKGGYSQMLINNINIYDFRVAFHLCFKASPSVKPFIWKCFIHTQILVHLHVNKINFHMKGFALGFTLKQR